MADPIVFPGTVEWSGENPGISLKDRPDGPFVGLASFFRVVLSPHGRGHALVLLQSPETASPPRERANYCLHDNEALARYLVAEFVSNFGAYRDLAGLQNLSYRTAGAGAIKAAVSGAKLHDKWDTLLLPPVECAPSAGQADC